MYNAIWITAYIYVNGNKFGLNLIVVNVNDTIVLSAHISDIVNKLNAEYDMQDLGDLQHYLGIVIKRDGKAVRMHQKPFTSEIDDWFAYLLPKTHTQAIYMPPCYLLSSSVRSHDRRRVLGRVIVPLLFHISR